MVAVFDNQDDLDNWIKGSDLHQEFMYTIHGIGEIKDLSKYKKTL